MKGLLRYFALGYFSVQRLSLLLKLADIAQPVRFILQRRITLAGDNRRVLRANFQKRLAVLLAMKSSHWVGATKRERVRFRQIVPQLLESNRGRMLSVCPQQGHHFSEHGHSWFNNQ